MNRKPVRKVKAGASSGAVVTAIVVILTSFGVEVPAPVVGAAVTIASFVVSYVVKPA